MGPILTLAVIAVAVGIGWRSVRREHGRVVSALKKVEGRLKKSDDVTLVKDPDTGVYRAKK